MDSSEKKSKRPRIGEMRANPSAETPVSRPAFSSDASSQTGTEEGNERPQRSYGYNRPYGQQRPSDRKSVV